MRVCEKVFNVGFVVLDSMSPARVGAPLTILQGCTTGFPKKTGWPGFQRCAIDRYNLHSCTSNPPPPTVAHQPRAGYIRGAYDYCHHFHHTP